jgi:hypothetical protein
MLFLLLVNDLYRGHVLSLAQILHVPERRRYGGRLRSVREGAAGVLGGHAL